MVRTVSFWFERRRRRRSQVRWSSLFLFLEILLNEGESFIIYIKERGYQKYCKTKEITNKILMVYIIYIVFYTQLVDIITTPKTNCHPIIINLIYLRFQCTPKSWRVTSRGDWRCNKFQVDLVVYLRSLYTSTNIPCWFT